MRQILTEYLGRLMGFSRNAKLFLLATFLSSLAFSVYYLFFNLYVLSYGYGQDFLGLLVAIPSLVTAIAALPAGALSDRIGHKPTMMIGGIFFGLSSLGMALTANRGLLILLSVGLGLGNAVLLVIASPFMTENSSDGQRTYLFSTQFGLITISSFIGSLVAGPLPEIFAGWFNVPVGSPVAYRGALVFGVSFGILAVVPVIFIQRGTMDVEKEKSPSPRLRARFRPRKLLSRLLLPVATISLGAGLLMPFMNVFFRLKFETSDALLGTLFAVSGATTAVGVLAGPALAKRLGIIHALALTQLTSIPFLILLGFSPNLPSVVAAYLIRAALMNMGYPLYRAFAMEQVTSDKRATLSSLFILTENVGWGLAAWGSGYVQALYGFNPIFLITGVFYVAAAALTYVFFAGAGEPTEVSLIPEQGA